MNNNTQAHSGGLDNKPAIGEFVKRVGDRFNPVIGSQWHKLLFEGKEIDERHIAACGSKLAVRTALVHKGELYIKAGDFQACRRCFK